MALRHVLCNLCNIINT